MPGDDQRLSGVVGGRALRPVVACWYSRNLIRGDHLGRLAFPRHPQRVPSRERDQPGADSCGGRYVHGGKQPVQHAVPASCDRRAGLVRVGHCLDATALLTRDAGESHLRRGHVIGGAVAPEPFQRLPGELRGVIQPPLRDPGIGQRVGDLRLE